MSKKTVLIPVDEALRLTRRDCLRELTRDGISYQYNVYEYHQERTEGRALVVSSMYVAFEVMQGRDGTISIPQDCIEDGYGQPPALFVRAVVMEPYTVTAYREAY